MSVSRPNVPSKILADGVGERDAVQVAKSIPRVLNHVKQDKEQAKQQQYGRNSDNHHCPLDLPKHVRVPPLLWVNSQTLEAVIRNQNP